MALAWLWIWPIGTRRIGRDMPWTSGNRTLEAGFFGRNDLENDLSRAVGEVYVVDQHSCEGNSKKHTQQVGAERTHPQKEACQNLLPVAFSNNSCLYVNEYACLHESYEERTRQEAEAQ